MHVVDAVFDVKERRIHRTHAIHRGPPVPSGANVSPTEACVERATTAGREACLAPGVIGCLRTGGGSSGEKPAQRTNPGGVEWQRADLSRLARSYPVARVLNMRIDSRRGRVSMD